MKTYQLLIPKTGLEDNAIALVDSPAIEETFVALAKQEEKRLYFADEQQHLLYGAVLVPDMLIYRNQDGMEFNVYFSKDTVKEIAHTFLRSNNRFNLEHQFSTYGIEVVESWLKSDEDFDKSLVIGLTRDLPIGTWFIGAKVNNDAVWNEVINGTFHGFSLEGTFNMKEEN